MKGGPIQILKENIIYPAIGASFVIMGGPADFVIYMFERCCCPSLHRVRTRNRVEGRTLKSWYLQETAKEKILNEIEKDEKDK